MRFPFLSEQIYELRTRDYRNIGLRGNPAYCELHRGDDVEVHIPREPLESTLKSMLDKYANGGNPKHIYMFSREGGAGKSHTNRVMEEYCRQKNLPFIIWDDDEQDEDLDISVRSIRYLIHIADPNKVVFFRECDAPEDFYAKLLSIEDIYIVGHGHDPEEELRGTNDSFKVFDLEEDYSFSREDIQRLLRKYIRKIRRKPILTIPDKALKRISKLTTSPGDALNMLGAMLAVAAYKAKSGKDPQITDDDIQNCCNERVIETLSYYKSDDSSN